MPSLKSVGASWHILDRETPIAPAYIEVGMIRNGNVAVHPSVHIALEFKDLTCLTSVALNNVRRSLRLRTVEPSLLANVGMHIVHCLILVPNRDRLPNHRTQNMWLVDTTDLLDDDGRTWRLVFASCAILDTHMHILQLPFCHNERIGLLLCTTSSIAGRVYGLSSWCFPRKLDGSRDCATVLSLC